MPASSPFDAACNTVNGHCKCPWFTAFFDVGAGASDSDARASLLQAGAFTGALTEALIALSGCTGYLANYGGAVLVRRTGQGWLPIAYHEGFLPLSCTSHRGADGLERLACLESYGQNQGSYASSATVVDFVERRYGTLFYSTCEDGRDVRSVRWRTSDPFALDVEVVIDHGMRRENSGLSCETVGGKRRSSVLSYTPQLDGYAPNERSAKLLQKLADPPELDPKVRSVLAAKPPEVLPDQLRPKREPLELTDVCPCTP